MKCPRREKKKNSVCSLNYVIGNSQRHLSSEKERGTHHIDRLFVRRRKKRKKVLSYRQCEHYELFVFPINIDLCAWVRIA